MTGSSWEQQALGVGGLVSLGVSGHPWGAKVCVTGYGQDSGFCPEWVGSPTGPEDCPWRHCVWDALKGKRGAPGVQSAPSQACGVRVQVGEAQGQR